MGRSTMPKTQSKARLGNSSLRIARLRSSIFFRKALFSSSSSKVIIIYYYMKLSNQLYQFLVQQHLFDNTNSPSKQLVPLTEAQQALVENATVAAVIARSIWDMKSQISQRPITPIPQLQQLKKVNTQSTKLYNWNLVLEALKQLQVPHEIDIDIKKLILLGDTQVIEDSVHNIFVYHQKLSEIVQQRVKPKQQLSQSKGNTLEFLTVNLSKWLSLDHKQVISLYADNFRYLAQIFTKGIQRIYEPVIGFYEDMLSSTDQLISIISTDEAKALPFTLNIFKIGLVSKSEEVAINAIKVMGYFSISSQRDNQTYCDQMHKWFIENGLSTTLLSMKRHPQLIDSLVDLILQFCKQHLVAFFIDTLKTHQEQLIILDKVYDSLSEHVLEELFSLGIIGEWLQLCFVKITEFEKVDEKIAALRLMISIHRRYHSRFKDSSKKIQEILKDCCLHQSQVLSLTAAMHLFQMIEVFGKDKVAEAPTLYKLVGLLIVQQKSETLLHFLLQNILLLIQNIPSIPLSVVLDPLIGLMQNNSTDLTISTFPSLMIFQFINTISTCNLNVRSHIQLLDVLSKMALYDTIHYQIVFSIMLRIIANNIEEIAIQEFIVKFTKVALAVYFALFKKGVRKVLQHQRAAQVIEILKQLLQFNDPQITDGIKLMASHTNLQFKFQFQKTDKGLNSLLAEIGDLKEIMSNAEIEFEQQKASKLVYSESSVKEIRDVQSNLKKFSKQKLSKEEQYHLARLRMPRQADEKVIKELNDLKQKVQQKAEHQQQDKVVKELQEINQKHKIRQQLERRQIEQGVATLNQKDIEFRLIFPDGSKDISSSNGLLVFDLIDMKSEEDITVTLLEIELKKYRKVLRFLFTKYSNQIAVKHNQSFDNISKRLSAITVPEIIKLIHEYELHLSYDQVQQLCRQVSVQLLHNKKEFKEFDFNGFQTIFVQLAIIITPGLAPHLCFRAIIHNMRTLTAAKAQSTSLFDDPENQYFNETEVIKEFNSQLKNNPDYELPQSYEKVADKQILLDYNIDSDPVYSILSDILYEVFNFRLIEPIGIESIVYRARPNAFGYITSKLQERSPPKAKSISTSPIPQKKKVLQIEPKRELSFSVKLTLSKYGFRDRANAEVVANLLDDMIHAVEKNKSTIDRSNQIVNKALDDKKQLQLQQQLVSEKKEEKRKEREKQLKDQVQNNKIIQQSRIEEGQKSKPDKVGQSKQQEQKKQYLNEIKEKIKEHAEKQKQESLQKLLEEQKQKELQEKNRKEAFQAFNKQQIDKLQKLKQQNKLSIQENLAKVSVKVLRESKLHQKAKQEIQFSDQKIKQEQQLQIQIADKFSTMTEVINKYSFGLKYLFQFLINETFFPVGEPASRDSITLKTFSWFADKFNWCPEIISIDETTRIFRQITKDKLVIDLIPIGMNYNDFLFALFRVALKGSDIFNKVALRIKNNNNQSIQEIVEEQSSFPSRIIEDVQQLSQSPKPVSQKNHTAQRSRAQSHHSGDVLQGQYSQLLQCNIHTFEAFILYLDISNDRNQLDHRFRRALEEKKIPTKIRRQQLREKLGVQ